MTHTSGFRLLAPARLDQVRLMVLAAMAVCREVLPEPELLDAIELALAETLNNVVEHNACTAMEVAIAIDAGAVVLTVLDDGEPWPESSKSPALPDGLAEGGYGLFLIHQVMDEVAFGREGERNYARLVKRLEQAA